jgi:hypothetical protein
MRAAILSLTMVSVVLSATFAGADEKSHRAAAEKLLVISKTEETMKKSIQNMLDLQTKQQPVLKPLRPAMEKFFEKHLSYASIKDELIELYVAEFTEEELTGLAEFYQTPLGKKAVEKLPVLMSKGGEIGMKRVQENQAELQQLIRDELTKPKPPATE